MFSPINVLTAPYCLQSTNPPSISSVSFSTAGSYYTCYSVTGTNGPWFPQSNPNTRVNISRMYTCGLGLALIASFDSRKTFPPTRPLVRLFCTPAVALFPSLTDTCLSGARSALTRQATGAISPSDSAVPLFCPRPFPYYSGARRHVHIDRPQ